MFFYALHFLHLQCTHICHTKRNGAGNGNELHFFYAVSLSGSLMCVYQGLHDPLAVPVLVHQRWKSSSEACGNEKMAWDSVSLVEEKYGYRMFVISRVTTGKSNWKWFQFSVYSFKIHTHQLCHPVTSNPHISSKIMWQLV